MLFDQIETLKRKYTDKYVVVDETRLELRRFKGQTGTIKTVNMNGRALVEFDGDNNIGWYDIELDCLKFIDQPLPKPEEKPAKKAEKPAAKAPAEKPAVAKAPAAAAGGAAKMSVADMLAAARAGGAAAKPSPVEAKTESAPVAKAKAPIVSKPTGAAAADPKKMSTADILAMARGGGKPASAAPAKSASAPAVEEEPVAEEPVAEAEAVTPVVEKPKQATGGAKPTSVEEIVAFCRKVDSK